MPQRSSSLFLVLFAMILLSTPLWAASQFGGPHAYDAGGVNSMALVVADVNGDGKSDLILANDCKAFVPCPSGTDTIAILLGNGDGTFQPAQTINSDFGASYSAALAVGDVNHDGKLDIVATYSSSGIGIFLGNGDGTFQQPQTYFVGGYITAIFIRDLNNDGKADLITAGPCGQNNCANDGAISVLLGNGNGTFQTPHYYDAGGPGGGADGGTGISLAMADVNGDGKLDAITGLPGATGQGFHGYIGVLLGNGDGSFQPPVLYSSGGESLDSVAVADLNGDGILDVVATNACDGSENCGSGSVSVFLGAGNSTFHSATVTPLNGFYLCCVAVGDLTRDGKPDVIYGIHQQSGLSGATGLLIGNGDGTFQPPSVFSSGGQLENSTALGDLNGDGKLDLLVANAATKLTRTTAGDGNAVVRLNTYFSPTTTTLTLSSNTLVYGQTETLSATVKSAGLDVPSGKVVFQQDGVEIGSAVLTGGVAALSTTKLKVGSPSLTAVYSGDTFSAKSTSAALIATVTQAQVTLTLTSSPNPSVLGKAVKLTASFSSTGGLPHGTVTFTNGTVTLGTANINAGKAVLSTSALPRGSNDITATYAGSVDFSPASDSVVQVVN